MSDPPRLVKLAPGSLEIDPGGQRLVSCDHLAGRRPVDMIARLGMLAALAMCGLCSGACSERALDPNQSLLNRVHQAGFEIRPGPARNAAVQRMMDYHASRCFEAYHHPTTLSLCFHDFKTGIKAMEAGTQLSQAKWPAGHYWVTTVRGLTLVQVDSQLKDRPIANKLISLFQAR
jgi:hypothetical protein